MTSCRQRDCVLGSPRHPIILKCSNKFGTFKSWWQDAEYQNSLEGKLSSCTIEFILILQRVLESCFLPVQSSLFSLIGPKLLVTWSERMFTMYFDKDVYDVDEVNYVTGTDVCQNKTKKMLKGFDCIDTLLKRIQLKVECCVHRSLGPSCFAMIYGLSEVLLLSECLCLLTSICSFTINSPSPIGIWQHSCFESLAFWRLIVGETTTVDHHSKCHIFDFHESYCANFFLNLLFCSCPNLHGLPC